MFIFEINFLKRGQNLLYTVFIIMNSDFLKKYITLSSLSYIQFVEKFKI